MLSVFNGLVGCSFFIYLWKSETAVNLSEGNFVLAPQAFMMGSYSEQCCEALNMEKTNMRLM